MRVVCIDDEHLALRLLERQLSKVEDVQVVHTFTNPLEGKAFIFREDVDVVILDIDMSPISGMDIAQQILEQRPDVVIVFVTAFAAYAVNAFELNATDYIVKPLKLDRLKMTMDRIKLQLQLRKMNPELQPEVLKIKIAPFLAFETAPEVFEPLPWRTAKSQELFIYLLLHRNVVIEKSAIIDLLWEDYEVEKAYSLLYTTIYNIRKQLKPYHEHIKLQNHSYGYLLELKKVEIDQDRWLDALKGLSTLDGESIEAYEEAMSHYNGPYLENYDYTWLEAEREKTKQIYEQYATKIAAFYMENGKLDDAILWYGKLLEHDPTIEDAHFQLMKLYELKGDFTAMMQQYNTLHKVCRSNLDTKPSEHIKEWYLERLK